MLVWYGRNGGNGTVLAAKFEAIFPHRTSGSGGC